MATTANQLTAQALPELMGTVQTALAAESADGAALITALRTADQATNFQDARIKQMLNEYSRKQGAKGGNITSAGITTGGTGYAIGDVLPVVGSTGGTGGSVRVTSVAGGVIDGVEVATKGGNYSGVISVTSVGVGGEDAALTAVASYEEQVALEAAIAAL